MDETGKPHASISNASFPCLESGIGFLCGPIRVYPSLTLSSMMDGFAEFSVLISLLPTKYWTSSAFEGKIQRMSASIRHFFCISTYFYTTCYPITIHASTVQYMSLHFEGSAVFANISNGITFLCTQTTTRSSNLVNSPHSVTQRHALDATQWDCGRKYDLDFPRVFDHLWDHIC